MRSHQLVWMAFCSPKIVTQYTIVSDYFEETCVNFVGSTVDADGLMTQLMGCIQIESSYMYIYIYNSNFVVINAYHPIYYLLPVQRFKCIVVFCYNPGDLMFCLTYKSYSLVCEPALQKKPYHIEFQWNSLVCFVIRWHGSVDKRSSNTRKHIEWNEQ